LLDAYQKLIKYRCFDIDDAVGQLVGVITQTPYDIYVARTQYDLRGQRVSESSPQSLQQASALPLERKTYDDAGRVIKVLRYFAPNSYTYINTPGNTPVQGSTAGLLESSETYSYDADNRITLLVQKNRKANWAESLQGGLTLMNDPTWRSGQTTSESWLTERQEVLYSAADGSNGYDGAGRLVTYRFAVLPNGLPANGYTHTYTYTYEGRDSYLEKTVTGVSNNNNFKSGSTTSYYDAYGRRVAIYETDYSKRPTPQLRYFGYNGDGQMISRRDGNATLTTFSQSGGDGAPRVNGEGLIEYPENPIGHIVDDQAWQAMSNAQRAAILAQQKTHRYHYANGQQLAETTSSGQLEVTKFLTNFSSSTAGTQRITVQVGDTLQSIAQRVYGNSSLWYVLAAANGIGNEELAEGTQLSVPEVKTNQNDASTFQPYNPAEITGPTTPDLPFVAPPKPSGCVQIIMIVVLVAVTVFTAGAASLALSASAQGIGFGAAVTAAGGVGSIFSAGLGVLAGGAIAASTAGTVALAGSTAAATIAAAFAGGVVGSIASQAVGSALDSNVHFSLRSALSNGLTTAVSAGIGSALQGASWAQGAKPGALSTSARVVQGVGNYAGGVVANAAVGKDTNFSWAGVALLR
jgi:large repetitive protein